jgi:hypothetical protein
MGMKINLGTMDISMKVPIKELKLELPYDSAV